MFPTCFATDRSETTRIPATEALVRAALGHQREHVAFPGGERAEPIVAAAGAQKLRDDLRVESAAPGCAYTLGCEVDGVATSSKGASLSVAARGVLSECQCWGTGEPVQDRG
jgi:hypothetical protein